MADALTAGKLDKRMSSHQVVIDDSLQGQLTDRSRKTRSPGGMEAIHEVVDQLHIEALEREDPLVRWQGTMAQRPEDVSIDEANVDQAPKEVLPSFWLRPAHAVVRPHLVHVIDPSHQAVVGADAGRHGQLQLLALASSLHHFVATAIVRHHHVHISLGMPIDDRNVGVVGPLDRLSGCQPHSDHALREVTPRRARRATHVRAGPQEGLGQVD